MGFQSKAGKNYYYIRNPRLNYLISAEFQLKSEGTVGGLPSSELSLQNGTWGFKYTYRIGPGDLEASLYNTTWRLSSIPI